MRMMQVTQWFGGDVKPEKKGVYERFLDTNGYFFYSYWDGKKWCCSCRIKDDAANYKVSTSKYQDCIWRGLAEKPKK